jgi:alpha-L-fucosidase
MLKSSVNFKSHDSVRCKELELPDKELEWWKNAKIGMFIHWGLYSILGRGEWVSYNEQIPWDIYKALADEFNPQNFKMNSFCELAKGFGAKYTVLVSRHHDGFALWNSKSSFNNFTTWHTASHRDFVDEYIEVCRNTGMRVGIYYSLMDWRFPGYFNPIEQRDNANLMKKQCYSQIAELTGNYGPIDILWYDGGWLAHNGSDADAAWFWEPIELNKIVRKNNPNTLINPRSGFAGDFCCDEGIHEITGKIIKTPWEKCMNIWRGPWGWSPNIELLEFDELIHMLANVICRGGNWLVNVGPDRNGIVPENVLIRMYEIGKWLKQNGEAIYNTRSGPIEPEDGVFGTTFYDNLIYVHILDQRKFYSVNLGSYTVKACTLLNGEKLQYTQNKGTVVINVPNYFAKEPDLIIKLALDKPVMQELEIIDN